ncbi:TIGR03086 family protein [Tsukamurella sp. TY48]|nr:TIGR03086 family metal-binding protein [Tsukamurella sp. TY48]GIZ96479.1 TIGR03086 family protein [Tsukamurella sp. TY48]
MTNAATDPRSHYAAAAHWVHALLGHVTADQLDRPTPCGDLDVGTLARHLVALGLQSVALAEAATAEGQPVQADEGTAEAFAAAHERAVAAWAAASLDREVIAPWGPATGAIALGMYANELLVHGWDLAVATGQPAEVPDGAVAAATETVARVALPAELRAIPGFPFGPVVEPRDGAGPTERLANWNGRDAAAWVRTANR